MKKILMIALLAGMACSASSVVYATSLAEDIKALQNYFK